jgi:hypothetical protein
MPAGEAMDSIARKHCINLPPIRDGVGMNILSNIAVEFFANSNPENKHKKKGRPLGLVAISLVEFYTGQTEPEAFALLEEPMLHAYGHIEQTYLDLRAQAKRIDTVESGNWPLLMKAMTIPADDSILTARSAKVDRLASSRIGHALVERLRVIQSYPQLLSY